MVSPALSLSIAVAAAALLVATEAKPTFPAKLPNGANVAGVPAVGHSDGTGSSEKLNAFGKAFESAGNKWTTALCQADSDGDGQTNGQELGDPCCTWTSGSTPKFTSGVSNPGDASSKVSASVLAANTCSSTTTTGTTTTTTPTTAPTTAPSAATASSTSAAVLVVGAAAAVWTQW